MQSEQISVLDVQGIKKLTCAVQMSYVLFPSDAARGKGNRRRLREGYMKLEQRQIVLYLVVLIQLSDDYHPSPFSHRSAPETFSELFAAYMEKEKLLFVWVEATTRKTSACVLRL